MSFTIYVQHANGSKYAYEVESYRDPVTRKPRQHRVYLGRVDLATNEIIPKKTKHENAAEETNKASLPQADSQTEALQSIRKVIDQFEEQNKALANAFDQMSEVLRNLSAAFKSQVH